MGQKLLASLAVAWSLSGFKEGDNQLALLPSVLQSEAQLEQALRAERS